MRLTHWMRTAAVAASLLAAPGLALAGEKKEASVDAAPPAEAAEKAQAEAERAADAGSAEQEKAKEKKESD